MRTFLSWRGPDPERVDAAAVDLGPDRLSASVTADWRLGYRLETDADRVTRSPDVRAWVSVPDMGVHVSEQRYSYVDGRYVDFEASDFRARIECDADGLVVDYPSIGRRL